MKKYTENELQKILDDHKLWLSGKGGQRANLKGDDLRHTGLYNADLSGADLSHADFRFADLSKANLSGADLSHANLSHANLSHANLPGAYLNFAALSGADLSYANLFCADLDGTTLRCADLYNSDLSDASLTDANLRHADLMRTKFDNTLILGEPVNKAPLQLYDLPYHVLITDTMMKIGCQVHSIDEWLAFTVEEINAMESDAKKFYKNYGKLIKAVAISHRVPKEENKES